MRSDSIVGHTWFRLRMIAYRSGLLAGSNEVPAFEAHRAACVECREEYEAIIREDAASLTDTEHIPASTLACWASARRGLRGIERTLVREHLAHCAACREDLERIGESPVLEAQETISASEAPRPMRRPARATWWIGTWAGAATAALVVVALLPRFAQQKNEAEIAAALVLSNTRGAEPQVASIAAGASVLVIRIPPIEAIRPDGDIRIEILDDGGRRLAARTLAARHLENRTALVAVRSPDGVWKGGRYAVRIDATAAGGARIELPVELRIATE